MPSEARELFRQENGQKGLQGGEEEEEEEDSPSPVTETVTVRGAVMRLSVPRCCLVSAICSPAGLECTPLHSTAGS